MFGSCVLIKEQMSDYASHYRVTMGCLKNIYGHIYGQNGFRMLRAFLETTAPQSSSTEAQKSLSQPLNPGFINAHFLPLETNY